MKITASMVKELRQKTGAGMMDCKKALQEVDGDVQQAIQYLRKKGIASAAKKAGRATSQGMVEAYIHPGNQVGVLVEVNCETDFVARTEEFKTFVRDVARRDRREDRRRARGQVQERGRPARPAFREEPR